MASNHVPTAVHTVRVRRIGEEQELAKAKPEGPQRDAALLRVAVLVHIQARQKLRDSGVSAKCAQIKVAIDGNPNSKRPYLTDDCCDAHKALKRLKEELTKRGDTLGVKVDFDMDLSVED